MAEGCVPAREKPVARGSSHTILQQKPPPPHTHTQFMFFRCLWWTWRDAHGAINGLVMKEHGSFYILSLFNTFNVWVLFCVHCVRVMAELITSSIYLYVYLHFCLLAKYCMCILMYFHLMSESMNHILLDCGGLN